MVLWSFLAACWFFFFSSRRRHTRSDRDWSSDVCSSDLLDLVVEVLSPTTARADRFTKRRLYQEVGIPAYWIVDAEEHYVEIWRPDASLPKIGRASCRERV